MMETVSVAAHYDALVTEGNDPVYDPEPLRAYMEKWDRGGFHGAACAGRHAARA